MKNILAKQLINKILKIADMPLPGASYTSRRTQEYGLKFNIFNRNKLTQKLIDMPEDIKSSLSRKIDDFYNIFAKFLDNDAERSKFAGMVRIAVAKDTHVTKDVLDDLQASNPELLETAKFVDRYNLQLPSDVASLRSALPTDKEGNVISKSVGSDYWFRTFGYAYMDMMHDGYPFKVERLRNATTREIGPNVIGKEYYTSVNGKFKVGAVQNGYTFVIEKHDSRFIDAVGNFDNEQMIIFAPGEKLATQMQQKWFEQPIDIGRSCVILDGDLDTTNILAISCNAAQKLKTDNPKLFEKVYKIFVDENTGAFYLQKQNNFGAGRGERVFIGGKIYLNEAQVTALAKKDLLDKMFKVKPASAGDVNVEGEDMSFADMRDKYAYVYRLDDETKQKLLNAKPGSREYPYSIPALQSFKKYLDNKFAATSQDATSGVHTALEGYIFFMVAPIFVSTRNVAPGKTRGGATTTKHEYVANPENPLEVDRLKFVVLALRVSPARYEFAGRVTSTGKFILPPWRTLSTKDTFDEAVMDMKNRITAMGARYEEDETGNVIAIDLLPGLAPKSRASQLAQKAFENFIGKKPMQEEIEPHDQPQPIQPQPNKPQPNKPQPNKPADEEQKNLPFDQKD